eukprot:CAMPEP_0115149676 /NCGR_PEP_ID=MMETSP0227-20121206/64595_1 /TAXON_ID=89957 /ORGANISM="Polarella glacialis, Strain CCMP 1383" /LENGTH=88 /DNA_ID=CAMNT_0002559915 /DNA_START=87 /DNA_END=353 /DNA_ORIENTATION=+
MPEWTWSLVSFREKRMAALLKLKSSMWLRSTSSGTDLDLALLTPKVRQKLSSSWKYMQERSRHLTPSQPSLQKFGSTSPRRFCKQDQM